MLAASLLNTILYGVLFSLSYYLLLCLYTRRVIPIDLRELFFYITIFCVLGVSGEVFTNTIWTHLFGEPLWQYRLFPAHGGSVSYFFVLIWGALGFYKYLNDHVVHPFTEESRLLPGAIMGGEAILLEILYNGLFLLLFGDYIFYYLPDDLGIFSHLSCLEVIPFYFLVGFVTHALISQRRKLGYRKHILVSLALYWMIVAVVVFA